MELVELGPLTAGDWDVVLDGEADAFGSAGARLEWRPKDRHVAMRNDDGRLVAFAGAAVVEVEVAGEGLEVVGLGSLVVTKPERGRGLMPPLFEALMRLAETLGPGRAALFCREGLVPVYARRGFAAIEDPVWAEQPGGRIEMPLAFMWRALGAGAEWPPGRVDVRGLPF